MLMFVGQTVDLFAPAKPTKLGDNNLPPQPPIDNNGGDNWGGNDSDDDKNRSNPRFILKIRGLMHSFVANSLVVLLSTSMTTKAFTVSPMMLPKTPTITHTPKRI